ncbi:MAG: extracellular solute-binding protein [Solirubrobacterales bacterium]
MGTLDPTSFTETGEKGYGKLVVLFEELFPGIKVEPVDVLTTPIGEKVAAEKKTGKYAMDVALDGDTELEEQEAEGNLAKFKPANAVNLKYPTYSDPKGYAYQFQALYNGITYNTSALSESEVPTTWKELAEPKWHEKFEILGPTNVLSIRYIAESLYRHTFDAAAFKAAVANATITNNFETFNTDVGEGKVELNVFAPGSFMLPLKELGQPVEFANSEATFPNGIWTAVMTSAPHPEAARLFDAFLYTQEAQEAVASETYYFATIKGVPANSSWPTIELSPGQIPFQEVAAYTARAAKLAKELYPAGSEND